MGVTTTQLNQPASPAVGGLLAKHLAYIANRSEHSELNVPFASQELNGLAVLALVRAAVISAEGLARSVMLDCAVAIAEAVLDSGSGAGAGPVGHAAANGLARLDPLRAGALLDRALSTIRRDEQFAGDGWRALLLADRIGANGSSDPELDGLIASLVERSKLLSIRTRYPTAATVGQKARFVHLAGEVAKLVDDEELGASLSALFRLLVSSIGEVADPMAADGPLPTHALAQLILAADVMGEAEVRDGLLDYVVTHRVDSKHGFAMLGTRDRADMSPWIPLALVAAAPSTEGFERLISPRIPEPPEFVLQGVRAGRRLTLWTSGRATVTIDPALLDGFLACATRTVLLSRPTTSVAAGERVIALDALDRRTADFATRDFVDRQISLCLRMIVREVNRTGTWSGVEAVDVAAASATLGSAVAIGARRSGEETILRLLETAGGYVFDDRDGEVVTPHRLLARQAARALFCAMLVRAPVPASTRSGALTTVDDIIGDLQWISERGERLEDMPSDELARAALRLATAASECGSRRGVHLARALVELLSKRQLPSGALAPSGRYEQRVGDQQRWLRHRAGTGPWPIRAETQLRFVAACGAASIAREHATRALAFTLLHLWSPAWQTLVAGYDGRGRRGEALESFPVDVAEAAIWAMASVRPATGVRHRPAIGHRLENRTRAMWLIESLEPAAVDCSTPERALARGTGAVLLAGNTNEQPWTKMAVEDAARLRGFVQEPHVIAADLAQVGPPPLMAARVARLRAEVDTLHRTRAPKTDVPSVDAMAACRLLAARRQRLVPGPRLDVRDTGGWQAWALAFGLARVTRPGGAQREAIVGCLQTVLAAQQRDNSWPALTADETELDVQLTVLEELIRAIRIAPESAYTLRALRRGVVALSRMLDDAPPTSVVRACAVSLEIAAAAGDGPLKHAWHGRLDEQLRALRGPFGGLELPARDADPDLDRLVLFQHLALLQAVDPNWIINQ